MAMPGKKFADAVAIRFSKGPTATTDDAAPPETAEGGDEGGQADDDEALEQGKVALSAVQAKDPAALRAAIKAIVHECMEEYGVGK